MRQITPPLPQLVRTENKDWQTKKVLSLLALLHTGQLDFTQQPLYLVQHPFYPPSYFIYDGNTRHFLAEQGLIRLENFYLLETDDDLQEVRRKMQEIYWPGQDLGAVTSYLSSRTTCLQTEKAAQN